ncbi:uncharacterized protein LOC131598484 [Vicia villosa]|uniref:uncharacterized protein LOC131598484 n=1 Tax=Vicia villosa TaxID=3911 RepID=UPI00273C157A|nr:uncharacterized protein LOC131598484 [Vicia villosa]
MKLDESVTNFFGRTMIIANKMRIHRDRMEGVTIVEKILRSMTAKYNFVVCSIEESKDIDSLTIDELQSSLGGRGRRRERGRGGYGRGDNGRSSNHNNNPANYQNLDNSERGKGRGGYRGGNHSNNGGNNSNNNHPKSNVECYRCHKDGHY